MARTSKQSLASIEAEISRLKAQADQLRERERVGVIERIRDAIGVYHITGAELGFRNGGSATKRVGKKRATSTGKEPTRAAKYKDTNGNTWSGMGKRPNWFKEALAAGTSPEQLLVK